MLITEFPNSSRSKIPFPVFANNLGKENIVVMASHDHLFTTFDNAPLSIKTTLSGQETYRFDGIENAVDSDTFLLLNGGRAYKSIIDSDFMINSFSLFFKDGIAENILASIRRSQEENIDTPHKNYPSELFLEQIINKKGPVEGVLKKIKCTISEGNSDQLLLDELFYEMMEALLKEHQSFIKRIDDISSIKKSTRVEIYQRVSKAKKYIHAHYSKDFLLKDLAAVAHLSEYHFLRMFKAFLASTPYQYITERRIFKAKEYLIETDYPVKEICGKVGYSDESSFSRLFKKDTGLSPSKYREDKK